MSRLFILVLSFLIVSMPVGAKTVGNKKADSYFKKRKKSSSSKSRVTASAGGAAHYLALHLGGYLDDESYSWGNENKDGVGKMSLGLTYRLGEWVNSSDMLIRVDINSFGLPEGNTTKMSFIPMVTFPDANSGFPLYFGAGVGLGVFFKQIESESALSLDYQLVAGARFFNVLDSIGLFMETGLKNHIHLLSDGQFNGVFVSAGTVFAF
ncbi:MAG: hypothetical protein HOO06_03185 [Bdellovibrionaceae bacterium]|jgi:hypothetical protein|nr:hypothetical protein [Pseudobdellovibrionaceae bacterium]